ncbi:serine protease inhibitor I/II-like [Leptopilina heterotoma]|uniref:serine protease inhibitor I/II-like n=1 Tax=Leptopilina heterotoma TaxID=63436 RepID=UPI001CA8C8D1|nr:serine protease inhibitor I/II-like [Leptopilina heterotoma]
MKIFVFLLIAVAAVSATKKCQPGTSFMIKCNFCVCSEDGTQIACTKMACPPGPEPWGPLYIPGTPCPADVFYSECNQCVCGSDGKSAACTLILCDAFQPSK